MESGKERLWSGDAVGRIEFGPARQFTALMLGRTAAEWRAIEAERDEARRQLAEAVRDKNIAEALMREVHRRHLENGATLGRDLREAAECVRLLIAWAQSTFCETDHAEARAWGALPAWLRREIERGIIIRRTEA
jgi:hypothetical protein